MVYLPSTGNLLREKEQRIESLERKLADRESKIIQLQNEYDERTQWCLRLDETVQARDTTILDLQEQFEELRNELEERNQWARQVSQENEQKDQRILQLQKDFEERTAWALRLEAEVQMIRQQIDTIKQSKLYRLSKTLNLVPKIEKS